MLTYHVDKASIYNHEYAETSIPLFSKARTRAVRRIGPHNKELLDVAICGMLGDWSADKILGQISPSYRFSIDQGIRNSAYLHHLNGYFYDQDYCPSVVPKLLTRPATGDREAFDYRLTFFPYTSFAWIYDSFYQDMAGVKTKVVPSFIADYLTPRGLAHWIMQDGSRQMGQGISLATNSFPHEDCMKLRDIAVQLPLYSRKSRGPLTSEGSVYVNAGCLI
jgi:hypothetical protein